MRSSGVSFRSNVASTFSNSFSFDKAAPNPSSGSGARCWIRAPELPKRPARVMAPGPSAAAPRSTCTIPLSSSASSFACPLVMALGNKLGKACECPQDTRREQVKIPCYQEVRSHGRNRREIPMRKDVPFRDTVRDWYTGFCPSGGRSKTQDCTPSRIGSGKSGKYVTKLCILSDLAPVPSV